MVNTPLGWNYSKHTAAHSMFLTTSYLPPQPHPPNLMTSRLPAPNGPFLQSIYGTISKDLLVTILSPNTTTAAAWRALEHIFIDSKPSRVMHLKHRFTNTKLAAFPNMNTYCKEIKSIADQLKNVDAPIDNDAFVLHSSPAFLNNSTALLSYSSRPLLYLIFTRRVLNCAWRNPVKHPNFPLLPYIPSPTTIHILWLSLPPLAPI